MAQVVSYRAGLSIGDSRNKLADMSWSINSTMFTTYSGAADAAARAATPVGLLMAGIEGLTDGAVFARRVIKEIDEDAATFPADSTAVFNFDKITVSLKAGADRYTMTIPARDNDAINTGMVDGVIDIAVGTRTTEVDDFIVALANGLIAKNGSQAIVQKMYVNR